MQFAWIFFGCIIGASCSIVGVLLFYDSYQTNRNPTRSAVRQPSLTDRDEKYALDIIRDDSVYQFLLGKSRLGWAIVLAVIASQIWLLFLFVKGAEIDLVNGSDLVYYFKCPRDEPDCTDTSEMNWEGWAVFVILMAAHLLKDIINGSKMIMLAGKERHTVHTRMRYFLGGTLLVAVSLFTCYVTTIYNVAIATTNTEIVVNSVIILFVIDIDEMFYDVLTAANPNWVEAHSITRKPEHDGDDTELRLLTAQNLEMQDKVQRVEIEMEELRGYIVRIQEWTGFEDPPPPPQAYDASDEKD